jgi:hypothetical protein
MLRFERRLNERIAGEQSYPTAVGASFSGLAVVEPLSSSEDPFLSNASSWTFVRAILHRNQTMNDIFIGANLFSCR